MEHDIKKNVIISEILGENISILWKKTSNLEQFLHYRGCHRGVMDRVSWLKCQISHNFWQNAIWKIQKKYLTSSCKTEYTHDFLRIRNTLFFFLTNSRDYKNSYFRPWLKGSRHSHTGTLADEEAVTCDMVWLTCSVVLVWKRRRNHFTSTSKTRTYIFSNYLLNFRTAVLTVMFWTALSVFRWCMGRAGYHMKAMSSVLWGYISQLDIYMQGCANKKKKRRNHLQSN